MSTKTSGDGGTQQVSFRVDGDAVEQMDKAILQAKANGYLPMDYSRSDALRSLVEMVADDPSMLPEYDETGEQ